MGEPQPLQPTGPLFTGAVAPRLGGRHWRRPAGPPSAVPAAHQAARPGRKRSGAAEDARDQRGDLGITVRDRNPVR